MVRDTVIAPQKLPGGLEEEEYHHHNVLSANINGTWGDGDYVSGSAAAGERSSTMTMHFEVPTTDATYDIDNLSIDYLCFQQRHL